MEKAICLPRCILPGVLSDLHSTLRPRHTEGQFVISRHNVSVSVWVWGGVVWVCMAHSVEILYFVFCGILHKRV